MSLETIQQNVAAGEYGNLTFAQALAKLRGAIEHGPMKVMTKMGISTISSYRGAQGFEATGGPFGAAAAGEFPERSSHQNRQC